MNTLTHSSQAEKIQQYYQFQSKIYDLTRWAFLFGRRAIVNQAALPSQEIKSILELGSGTGHNLILLAKKFPNAQIIGIDVSEDMVQIARKATRNYPNIEIRCTSFSDTSLPTFDLILCSYVLTMINPGWDTWIAKVSDMLNPEGGVFAVVDFHNTRFKWFRNHMLSHNVMMEEHLLPKLSANFATKKLAINAPYLGLWQYISFVGQKK
jgi:S-adenosylmethionine-diacylgycerolhomoserine-N-methlytransferase